MMALWLLFCKVVIDVYFYEIMNKAQTNSEKSVVSVFTKHAQNCSKRKFGQRFDIRILSK